MKLLERYGTPLISYEGSCASQFESGVNRLEFPGYFRACQYNSGRIIIGVIRTDRSQISNIPRLAVGDEKLSFTGSSTEGWQVLPTGQIFFSLLGWQFGTAGPPPHELTLSARYLGTSSMRGAQSEYRAARFLISNFLWFESDAHLKKPEPIELTVRGFRIEVNPVEDFVTLGQQLIHGRGTQPTAWVSIDSAGGPPVSLKRFVSIVEDLVCVFRLITGNEVNWYNGEALRTSTQEPVERVHQYAASAPYSNTIQFRHLRKNMKSLVPKLSLTDLTLAFFDSLGHSIDKETLRKCINQFTNAVSSTPFLESSGLIASTLMELIVSKYAAAKDRSEICPETTYTNQYLPTLKQVINSASVPRNVGEQAELYLQGAFRYTFRQKLRALRDGLRLPLSSQDISQIVETRNSYVHEGTYRSNWRDDYSFLIWAIVISLSRLCGYTGDLPTYSTNFPLEI